LLSYNVHFIITILYFNVEFLSFNIEFPKDGLIPIGSSGAFLNKLKEDDDETFAFKFRVANNLPAGTYSISYSINYEENGDEHKQSGTIGIIVSAEPELEIVAEIQNPVIGQTGKLNIKIVNKTPDLENIKSISMSELSELKPEDISSEDKVFVISVDEELLKSIMTKDNYEIPGMNSSAELEKYDLTLTKFDVIEILNSEDDISKYIEIIEKKNKLSVVEKTLFETVGKQMIKSELEKNGITLKEAVFLTVISEEMQNERNSIKMVEGFKDETLMIYPERFSFKLVRLLPVDTVQGFISK